ncbi:glutathione hydrolase 5 proenzyme-like [Salminus brasiliensis]|uniref:glutathione hydrolase 5 proenzyme-like n=1 Tax=Salminus brasiliensis TaxID=930266 RepID=UPI003B834B34
MAEWKKRIFICICILILGISTGLIVYFCLPPPPTRAAVAADSETCSVIGRDTLKAGGSAVDAAIAALLCTSVVNPQSTGSGGGSVFTVMEKDNGPVKIFLSRETVPKTFRGNFSDCKCKTGPQWIGVPGEIRGYEHVHRLYGRLPWASLFQPTIRLARDGVPISSIVAGYLPTIKRLSARELFEDGHGRMLKEGDTVKFERLADTLEAIAENGAEEFYSGDTAEKLICDIQEAGGTLTLEDLSSVEVSEVEPWKMSLGSYTVYFPPPPAGAAVVNFILNVMEGYDLNKDSLKGKERLLTYHRYIEASKFANGLRKLMRDPRFNSDVEKAAARIIEKEFADNIRKLITDDRTHNAEYYNVSPDVDEQGTTHVSVLAEDGMAVSVTSSINYCFGSGVLSNQTGVILNNQLADFCGKAEQIHPGERPPSSMAPMILRSAEKTHTIVIGGSGGHMITTGVALTLMNYLWFDESLKNSIAAPIVYVDSKLALRFEPDFDQSVREALRELNNTVKYTKTFYNVVNAVTKSNKDVIAYSDNRKNSKAAGY